MAGVSCFICYSVVHGDTDEEIREKYRQVVGLNLTADFHLCQTCCRVLNIVWMFKSVCKKRSMDYPELFSTKILQKNETEFHAICPEDNCIDCSKNIKCYTYFYDTNEMLEYDENHYEEIGNEKNDFDEYFQQIDEGIDDREIQNTNEQTYIYNSPDANQDGCDNINCNPDTDHINTDSPTTNYPDTNICLDPKESFAKVKKKKSKKNKYDKLILTLEQQKAELERRRKEKKYLEAEFKCYNCALGFLFKDTYQTHMMRHEESNGEYRCPTCTLRFASAGVLRAHTAGHAERALCARCGRAVRPRARRTHARRCGGGGDRARAACHLCAAVFSDLSGLQQHLKRFHQLKTSHRSYCCSVCGQRCANQAAVRTHMIKHINRKFDCDTCPSTFSSPYTLAQHKKKHNTTDEQQHFCEICHLSYSTRKSLLAHKRNTLNHQQTMHECPICNRNCPNQRALDLHIKSIHSGSKDYACPHCPQRYSNRKSLVRHIGSHTAKPEVKKAVCHMCGASFKGNNKLNRHLKQVCEKAKLEEEFACLYEQNCMNSA